MVIARHAELLFPGHTAVGFELRQRCVAGVGGGIGTTIIAVAVAGHVDRVVIAGVRDRDGHGLIARRRAELLGPERHAVLAEHPDEHVKSPVGDLLVDLVARVSDLDHAIALGGRARADVGAGGPEGGWVAPFEPLEIRAGDAEAHGLRALRRFVVGEGIEGERKKGAVHGGGAALFVDETRADLGGPQVDRGRSRDRRGRRRACCAFVSAFRTVGGFASVGEDKHCRDDQTSITMVSHGMPRFGMQGALPHCEEK